MPPTALLKLGLVHDEYFIRWPRIPNITQTIAFDGNEMEGGLVLAFLTLWAPNDVDLRFCCFPDVGQTT
jgi:hypothetical protein